MTLRPGSPPQSHGLVFGMEPVSKYLTPSDLRPRGGFPSWLVGSELQCCPEVGPLDADLHPSIQTCFPITPGGCDLGEKAQVLPW